MVFFKYAYQIIKIHLSVWKPQVARTEINLSFHNFKIFCLDYIRLIHLNLSDDCHQSPVQKLKKINS